MSNPSPNTPNPAVPLVSALIYALVAVLVVCAALVGAAAVFHVASSELIVSVLGLAGIIVAALVGLLNAQISNLHMTVNSRMGEMIDTANAAAFRRGQDAGPGSLDPDIKPVPPVPPVQH